MTSVVAAPTPGAPEKAAVRSMFDRIAPRYDLLNRLLSAGTDVRWRRRAVDFLELDPPLRVLDLCTGTADLLIEAVSRHPRSSGLGVDLAQGFHFGRPLTATQVSERLRPADAPVPEDPWDSARLLES
jgi:hypothetical protein